MTDIFWMADDGSWGVCPETALVVIPIDDMTDAEVSALTSDHVPDIQRWLEAVDVRDVVQERVDRVAKAMYEEGA